MGTQDDDTDLHDDDLDAGSAGGAADHEDDGNGDTPAEAKAREKAIKDIAGGDADGDGGEEGADDKAGGKGEGEGEGGFIPKGRFNEVNQRKKELEEQNARLLETIQAMSKSGGAAASDEGKGGEGKGKNNDEPAFDVKDARRQRLAALAAGDDEKALELDEKIEAYNLQQAEERAVKRMRDETQRESAVVEERELKRVGAEAKQKYPQLDPKNDQVNEDAIAFVVATRDARIAKGVPAHRALEQAVENAAKVFGWASPPKKEDAAAGAGKSKAGEERDITARARNADAAGRQPPLPSGRGERATGGARKSVAEMSSAEFKSLSEEELEELGGNR